MGCEGRACESSFNPTWIHNLVSSADLKNILKEFGILFERRLFDHLFTNSVIRSDYKASLIVSRVNALD